MTKEEFKAIRKKWGISQAYLAKILGCSHGTISNYEMGYKDIEDETAAKMRNVEKRGRC